MNKLPEMQATIDISGVEFSRMVDYFGVWAMHSDVFRGAVERVSRINLHMHMQESLELLSRATFAPLAQGMERVNGNQGYDVTSDGVAVIAIRGTMMKHVSSLDDGTSTVRARQNIRHAARNDAVRSILLAIDSPGGTVAGTDALAGDIVNAKQRKPVYAQIEDLGASAAYWIASQAEKVYANATALVGSIGTYGLLYDLSAYAEKEGVKALLFTTGRHKGAGAPGTAITEEQQAEFQRVVETLNEHFLAAVKTGRHMSAEQLAELADGRVFIAAEAHGHGLIDGVQSFEQTLNAMRTIPAPEADTQHTRRSKQMTQTAETAAPDATPQASSAPRAAGVDEIKAACPGADAAFILAQVEAQATLAQAQGAWIAEQNKRIASKDAELEQAQAERKRPGVEPLGRGAQRGQGEQEYSGDAVADFNARVLEKMKAGSDRRAAIKAVAKSDPELHQAFLLASNPGQKAQSLIRERFELM